MSSVLAMHRGVAALARETCALITVVGMVCVMDAPANAHVMLGMRVRHVARRLAHTTAMATVGAYQQGNVYVELVMTTIHVQDGHISRRT